MFREYKCGCIVSEMVGRIRICHMHRPDFSSVDGQGGLAHSAPLRGRTKLYPAFGQDVPGWTGK